MVFVVEASLKIAMRFPVQPALRNDESSRTAVMAKPVGPKTKSC